MLSIKQFILNIWIIFVKKIGHYFSTPVERGEKPMLLSTEEIATLWHLPGRVAETPTFTRIESKKAEPPANLPI